MKSNNANTSKNNTDNNQLIYLMKRQQTTKKHFLILLYKENIGGNIVKSMKRNVKNLLPETPHTEIGYAGRKRSTCFQIKDKCEFDHQHNLVYCTQYPCELSNGNYVGEYGRCIAKRIKDHKGMDYKSHLLKLSLEPERNYVTSLDFLIIPRTKNCRVE